MSRALFWTGLFAVLSAASANLVAQPENAATSPEPRSAWQSANPIRPAVFESYFPADANASKRLAESGSRAAVADEDLVEFVRAGLRGVDANSGKEWVRQVGQKLIFGRPAGGQDAAAIEFMYHASANRDCEYNALYYGLSRVEPKTPAILRRMIEIAMGSRDWINVIGHTAWAAQGHTEAMIAFLSPYLSSADPSVREHAEALKKIYAGELTPSEQWAKTTSARARAEYGDKMEDLRKRLSEGDSSARFEVLRTVLGNSLWLIMDDDWLGPCHLAAADPDPRVRQEVATLVGTKWVWQAFRAQTNPRAVDLLLRMSRDEDPNVRDNVRTSGLHRIRGNEAVQARLQEMQEEDIQRRLEKMKEHALAAIAEGRLDDVRSFLREIKPETDSSLSALTRTRITEFVSDLERRLAEAAHPKNELQSRIDAASEGSVIELPPGTIEGAILIEKALTLRGSGIDQTRLEHRGVDATVTVRTARGVQIEGMTVRWSPASKGAKAENPAAIAVRDSEVTLRSVNLEPVDPAVETPYGLMATGRSVVQFLEGRSRGFAYALIWLEGAHGKVSGSDLRGAGHSVITVHPNSSVEIVDNLLADCGYHAVRVTGGTVEMRDNIVMGCTRAGVYLGNKKAHGRIYNNLFTRNHGEIWSYSPSTVTLDHNVFYQSRDAAIQFWNTSGLTISSNTFVGSPEALRQYMYAGDSNTVGVDLHGNHYWDNTQDIRAGVPIPGKDTATTALLLEKGPTDFSGDPLFKDPQGCDFTLRDASPLSRAGKGITGLMRPQPILQIARRYNVRL